MSHRLPGTACLILAAPILAALTIASPVLAQSVLGPSVLAQAEPQPRLALPDPPVADNAPIGAFLRAAQTALITGRLGEAQEALERAQTRMLDRSVPLFQTNNPSQDPGVTAVTQALRALAAGDREATLRHIQAAMQVPGDATR